MYSCVRGIDFASFYEFSIGFLKTFLLDFYNFFLFDFLIVPTLWYFCFFFISLQFVNLQVDVLGYYYNFINYHVRLNVMTLRHDTNIWRLISIKTYVIEPLSVQCQIVLISFSQTDIH